MPPIEQEKKCHLGSRRKGRADKLKAVVHDLEKWMLLNHARHLGVIVLLFTARLTRTRSGWLF